MATAVLSETEVRRPSCIALDDRHGWGFALLLTTTATLFLRPADLIPALESWPIYQFLIIACLAVSARPIARKLAHKQLSEQPVTACLLLLLVAIGASHLSHGFLWGARMSMWEFCKPAAFYLLVIALVNTPQRLFVFMKMLVLTITTVAGLALLDRSGILSIAALDSIRDRGASDGGNTLLVDRIRGTGIFNDPNDFGLILVTGLILSICFLCRPRVGWRRHLWLAPTCLLLVVLSMTHSRGAFLSLACAVPAAIAYRRGIGIGVLSLTGLPLLAIAFAGRMTDFNALQSGTGQTRIQIWSESLTIFRQFPIFGLGEGMLVEESGVVAHNSFIHCFAELGIFGGTAFLSCFLAAGMGLWALRGQRIGPVGSGDSPADWLEVAHMRIFVFAALAAFVGGMLALSRQFVTPTYLVLGLATAAQSLSGSAAVKWKLNNRFLLIALMASAASLFAFYLAVRLLVHW